VPGERSMSVRGTRHDESSTPTLPRKLSAGSGFFRECMTPIDGIDAQEHVDHSPIGEVSPAGTRGSIHVRQLAGCVSAEGDGRCEGVDHDIRR